jgi:hypothetical protein
MITRAMAVAIGLSFCGTAFGKDSGHQVCSGVASVPAASIQADGDNPDWGLGFRRDENELLVPVIGISILVEDYRWKAVERLWILSWVFAGKLYQGEWEEHWELPGHVALKNGKRLLYEGTFSFESDHYFKRVFRNNLVLHGKVTDNPDGRVGRTKFYPIKAKLRCVDIST